MGFADLLPLHPRNVPIRVCWARRGMECSFRGKWELKNRSCSKHTLRSFLTVKFKCEMPPRRFSPRRASEGSTASTMSQTGKELAATVGATATRAWQNPLMRNAFLGVAAMVAALVIGVGFLMNPSYPVPPKGVVLVTGTSSGIGREVVNLLAKNGYHVFAGVRRRENVTEWNRISERRQHQIHPVMLDVTDKKQIDNAVMEIERYLREHGDLKFAGLVNNAGIGAHMPIEHHDMDDVRNMFETNLLGPLYLTQKLLPLIRREKGRIVFTSSLAGRITQPKEGIYSATKVGVEAVGDALRQELLPYECSVSLVEPGFVMTPILSKILRSEEMGNSTVAAETYSRYYSKKYFENFEFGIHHSGDVTRVARQVLAALTDARPKTRYATTNFMLVPTWLAIRAQQFIPDRLMDKILT